MSPAAQPPATVQQTPAVTPAAAQPAARPEIVRGRVTSDTAGTPLPGATVTVTRGPDREIKRTTAGPDGRWSVSFPNGTGDYLVSFASIARTPFRKRVTRGAPGQPAAGSRDSVYVVDAVLAAPTVTKLQEVTVNGKRPKPDRPDGFFGEAGTGAAERVTAGLNGAVSPDQAGDLSALAGTVPGISTAAGGISALGLGPGQSNVTLGGLAFAGGDLPRDARTTTRVTTSTYDPARGWFGAAQVAVDLAPGYGFSSRRAHVTADAPALQAVDPTGAQLGQRVGALQLSGGGEGTLLDDRWNYNVGGQLGRRTQDAPTLAGLATGAPGALLAAGVAPDSAERLLAVARAAGIPLGAAAGAWSPASRLSDQASFIARVDRPRYDPKTYDPLPRTYGVTAFGALRRNSALGVGPTALVTRGAGSTSGNAGLQGVYSAYVGPGGTRLVELRTGLSAADTRTTPYLTLPGASVLVGSGGGAVDVAAGGTTGDSAAAPALTALALGGNAALATHRRTSLWESQAQLAFLPPKRAKHRVTLTADARYDALREDPAADRLGTFGYLSLDDLAAGRPASYARTLGAPGRAAGVWNAFAAAGDYWRPSPRLQLLYGARLEANAYTVRPADNPALAQALGVSTGGVPNTAALSPRLGFTWYSQGQRTGMWGSNLGTFINSSPGVLRGGVGQFRNLLSPDLVSGAVGATGLPGANARLYCVGSAVPTAQWAAWAAGTAGYPTTCAGGAPSSLTDTAPAVTAIGPHYTAPRSWRANLAWNSTWQKLVAYGVEGVVSYNLNQPGTFDANFAGTPRFTTPEGRPVYVDPAAIVAASGAVAPASARTSPAFGRVAVLGSDLRSLSRQLTVTLAPATPQFGNYKGIGVFAVSGAYVLGRTTQQARGFDGAGFGDPRAVEWARGDYDVRHQFTLQAGWTKRGFSVTTFGRFASGAPYTPLVGGDVNGDGLANDRAYAFTPAQARAAGDTALAAATERLLAAAPAPARRCLTRLLGAPAARNACEGPWTATMNGRIAYDGELPRVGRRVGIALNLANPLGGLDQLLHGDALRGWGAPAFPDPILYQVRGFDPAAGTFRYAVNPRFGDTRPAATAFRAPFRATLDVRLDLGKPLGEQQLDRWLKPGRAGHKGTRLTADELMKRYARNVPDPYAGILQESDSLLLTPDQSADLREAQTRYKARTDSLWRPLVTDLAALGDHFDAGAVLKRQEAATDAAWELARQDVKATLPKILSPAQLRLLPWPADMFWKATEPMKGFRMFMAG